MTKDHQPDSSIEDDLPVPPAPDETGYFSDDAATFGDRLAAARRAMGLEQGALARKLGIKLKTLRSWEDDISEPRANKLQMVAGLLNVSLIWILTGEGEGAHDPWNVDETSLENADLIGALAELRLIRAEHKRFGSHLARLQKQLATILEK